MSSEPSTGLTTANAEEVLFRTRPRPLLLMAAVPFAVVLVFTVVMLFSGDVILMLAMVGVLIMHGVILALRSFELRMREPWTVRVGAGGVTWGLSRDHMTWPQLAEIRVKRRRPVWSWLIPGEIRLITYAELDFARRAQSKPIGTVVDTRYLDGGPEDVLAAIRRFVDVPVIRTERTGHTLAPWRHAHPGRRR